MAGALVVAIWYGFGWVSDLDERVARTEMSISVVEARVSRLIRDVAGLETDLSDLRMEFSALDGDVADAFAVLEGSFRDLEDHVTNLQDQVDDLRTELFYLGLDVSAPAPFSLSDSDQDRWCAEFEVALTNSAVLRRGSPLTVGDWLELIREPLVDAGCPVD